MGIYELFRICLIWKSEWTHDRETIPLVREEIKWLICHQEAFLWQEEGTDDLYPTKVKIDHTHVAIHAATKNEHTK